jgi:hypothetical protein
MALVTVGSGKGEGAPAGPNPGKMSRNSVQN